MYFVNICIYVQVWRKLDHSLKSSIPPFPIAYMAWILKKKERNENIFIYINMYISIYLRKEKKKLINNKMYLWFRKTWWIIYFTNSRFSSSFSQRKSCLRSMGENITSNRFHGITSKHGTTINLGHNLICYKNSYSKLIG